MVRAFVRIGKDDRPPSTTRQQQSYKKGFEHVCEKQSRKTLSAGRQMENIHADGNLERHEAVGPKQSR